MIPQNPVPMLWVIPADLLGVSAETVVTAISRLEGIQVWQIEGAVAFSLPGILVKRGRPLDEEAFLSRTRPLFRTINSFTISKSSVTDLELPDIKYEVRMSLQQEETNKRSCRRFKSHLNEWNPFAFRAYSSYELNTEEMESQRIYFANRRESVGFWGIA
jgi:hypothetical protein